MSDLTQFKAALDTATKSINDRLGAIETKTAELQKKADQPVYGRGLKPSQLFGAVNGPLSRDSAGYSILKAAAVAQGWLTPDQAKLEINVSNRLKEMYNRDGWRAVCMHPQSIVVPFATIHMPEPLNDAEASFMKEMKGHIKAYEMSRAGYDPEEADWINGKMGGSYSGMFKYMNAYHSKAFGTIADSAGGVLVGFPTLGELIELQRNLEVFANAGAAEITLPPNGRIQYPKQTGGSTAYWVGEASTITESTPSTGYLDLIAKKLAVFVKLNNELLRFTSPTTEALVRMDMALQAALKADSAMLEGQGGNQIKGLLTYETQSSWVQGTDKLITYTVTSNKFQPNDPADMEAKLPDEAGEPTAWVMRRDLWAKIRNRRADAVTTGDAAGPFVFSIIREVGQPIPLSLEGIPVVRSSQVSNTHQASGFTGGSQTYVVLGNFRDWLTARHGVMEFLTSGLGDTPFQNDQTWLRGIQHLDAGPRHSASFIFADVITIS